MIDTTSFVSNLYPLIVGGSLDAQDLFFGVIDDIIIAGNYGFCEYKEPEDSDSSGVYDFLEFGGPASLDTISGSQIITEETDTYFSVSSTSISAISYQWQFSDNQGSSWANINDTTYFEGYNSDCLLYTSPSPRD